MARSAVTALSLSILFTLFSPPSSRAQQHEAAQRMIPAVSIFVSGDYFAPNFRDVNAVYNTIGNNYYLPAGKDFKDYYSIMGGVRISPVEQQSVQLELGVSLFRSMLGNTLRQTQSINYLQMYYLGGTYLVNFPVAPFAFFAGAGPGWIWLNTERTYSGQPGSVRVAGNLFQLHGTGGVEYFHPTGVSIALEGGYSYATTLFPQRADLDFTLQGYTVGIKVTVPLMNSF